MKPTPASRLYRVAMLRSDSMEKSKESSIYKGDSATSDAALFRSISRVAG